MTAYQKNWGPCKLSCANLYNKSRIWMAIGIGKKVIPLWGFSMSLSDLIKQNTYCCLCHNLPYLLILGSCHQYRHIYHCGWDYALFVPADYKMLMKNFKIFFSGFRLWLFGTLPSHQNHSQQLWNKITSKFRRSIFMVWATGKKRHLLIYCITLTTFFLALSNMHVFLLIKNICHNQNDQQREIWIAN